MRKELIFDYFNESEFEENIGKVDGKESDKEPLFDNCYTSEFEDKEVTFIELLWSPKENKVALTNCEEIYAHEVRNSKTKTLVLLAILFVLMVRRRVACKFFC